jgi:peptidoglycan/LPS O-acetylase OafA/YrhL
LKSTTILFPDTKPHYQLLDGLRGVAAILVLFFPLVVWMGACGSIQSQHISKASKLLGDISYPLYIIHYPIMYIFYAWLIDKGYYSLYASWPMALLVVASSIVLAILCLKLYDEPVRRWLASKCKP